MLNVIIVIGDTQYEANKYYMKGVEAMRDQIPYKCNPYKNEEKALYWEYGHVNESIYPNHTNIVIDE